ncbi:MAG: hypothetical protein LH631_03065 [Alkalinema sp. CAN_BIN05]|nr:hypothetical protein [Alkalinema sp. CAN_BIN05]
MGLTSRSIYDFYCISIVMGAISLQLNLKPLMQLSPTIARLKVIGASPGISFVAFLFAL